MHGKQRDFKSCTRGSARSFFDDGPRKVLYSRSAGCVSIAARQRRSHTRTLRISQQSTICRSELILKTNRIPDPGKPQLKPRSCRYIKKATGAFLTFSFYTDQVHKKVEIFLLGLFLRSCCCSASACAFRERFDKKWPARENDKTHQTKPRWTLSVLAG